MNARPARSSIGFVRLRFRRFDSRAQPRVTCAAQVLLLFQKLDGADVCIFAMYMQEYGADAAAPNTRRVYLSYLDSI
eukprot:735743-Pyramimonas_sp.AAC.1